MRPVKLKTPLFALVENTFFAPVGVVMYGTSFFPPLPAAKTVHLCLAVGSPRSVEFIPHFAG